MTEFQDPHELDEGDEAEDEELNRGIGAVVLHHTVTAMMLALMIAIAVWAYLTFRESSFFQSPDESETSRVMAYSAKAQVRRIESALEVHLRLHGEYPPSLDVLVDRGLLLESDLYYPADEFEYKYERGVDSYTLTIQG